MGDDDGGIWTKKLDYNRNKMKENFNLIKLKNYRTIDKFKEKTNCMIDQYNQFYIKDVDKYVKLDDILITYLFDQNCYN